MGLSAIKVVRRRRSKVFVLLVNIFFISSFANTVAGNFLCSRKAQLLSSHHSNLFERRFPKWNEVTLIIMKLTADTLVNKMQAMNSLEEKQKDLELEHLYCLAKLKSNFLFQSF